MLGPKVLFNDKLIPNMYEYIFKTILVVCNFSLYKNDVTDMSAVSQVIYY